MRRCYENKRCYAVKGVMRQVLHGGVMGIKIKSVTRRCYTEVIWKQKVLYGERCYEVGV